MRTNTIVSTNFTGLSAIRIKPNYKKNTNRSFLYNEVLSIAREFKIPANFHANRIEIPSPSNTVLEKLKELAISYTKIK